MIAEREARPRAVPRTRRPYRREVSGGVERQAPAAGLGHDGRGERVLAARSRLAVSCSTVSPASRWPDQLAERGPSGRERAGLANTSVSMVRRRFDGLGVAEQHAGVRGAAGPTMMDIASRERVRRGRR